MKTKIASVLLFTAIAMFAGCASPRKATAYGHEQEFRQQLAQSVPVKDYGYSIRDLRFTEDYQKALVVFVHSDSKTRPPWEFTLASDDFGRYRGRTMQPFYTPGTGNTPAVDITVDLLRHQ